MAAWIANVLGYLRTRSDGRRTACRKRLDAMVELEIGNVESLLSLWKRSGTEFMAVSAGEETTFIYDRRFPSHLRKKIRLMEEFGDRPPRIDPDLMWRVGELS